MPQNPAEKANKISQESERKRKAEIDLHNSLDTAWAKQQADAAAAKSSQAARAAERAKSAMMAAAALGSSTSGRGGPSRHIPFKSPPSERQPKADGARGKPPPPDMPKPGCE